MYVVFVYDGIDKTASNDNFTSVKTTQTILFS